MHQLFTSLIICFVLSSLRVAAQLYCGSSSSLMYVQDDNNQIRLGYVSLVLNEMGTFGVYNDTDSAVSFLPWSTCDGPGQPMFLSILNTPNYFLGWASVISGVTDCDQAKLPGYLMFAPSDGNPQGRTEPGKTLTTFKGGGGWSAPSTFCGENMVWTEGPNGSGSWKPNWINPGGPIFTGLSLMYDRVANS
ncbi:hypothetical protein DL96DRAFT_1595305, partial [Flagelloscypha sp. PMI_526]